MEYFVKKNLKLSLDFDRYVTKNPQTLDRIPNGSWVVFTVRGDDKFNKLSWALAGRMTKQKQKMVEARKESKRWKIVEPVSI